MGMKRKKTRETMATGVIYYPSNQAFAFGGRPAEIMTEEAVESLGWKYDSFKNELYKIDHVDICDECDVEAMYDTEAEEFYCPKCSP